MEKLIKMTEVAPAPDVKPQPKPAVKPATKPRKDDPWTVPAPKVNPTPKAEKKFDMNKMLITTKSDFNKLKKIVTAETFYKKFTVSMDVVAEVTAEDAMEKLYFEDSRVASATELAQLKKSGLL